MKMKILLVNLPMVDVSKCKHTCIKSSSRSNPMPFQTLKLSHVSNQSTTLKVHIFVKKGSANPLQLRMAQI